MSRTADVSVIIPALEEAEGIEDAILSATDAFGESVEVIVADGGSEDDTVARASNHAHVIQLEACRGAQLNAGARLARGGTLVFLHADTRLDPTAGRRIRETMADPGTVGGCCRFELILDEPVPRWDVHYRLLARAVNLRTRIFRTATGDQAIFATRAAFDRIGGFQETSLFEDVAFVRSLRKLGRFSPVDAVAATSGRRWQERGFVRTVLEHWLLRTAYQLRIPSRLLARWYTTRTRAREAIPRG